MAIRTSENELREIISTDPDIDVMPFITFASTMTDQVSACVTDNELTITDAELKAIETYLAAHLYALRDPQPMMSKTSRGAMTFQGKTGKGLESTVWGQMALAMDRTGCLSEIADNKALVTGYWLGTERT